MAVFYIAIYQWVYRRWLINIYGNQCYRFQTVNGDGKAKCRKIIIAEILFDVRVSSVVTTGTPFKT